jgi:ankyrin repeat protein
VGGTPVSCTLSFPLAQSPLYLAARNGQQEIVQRLLKANADPTRPSSSSENTPLHEACNNGYEQVVEALLNRTSHINAGSSGNRIPEINVKNKHGK